MKDKCQKCGKIWHGWAQADICPDCGGKLEMEKKEEQRKTAGNLMNQMIKDLNAEAARTEELTREEKMKDAKKIKLKNLYNLPNSIICTLIYPMRLTGGKR